MKFTIYTRTCRASKQPPASPGALIAATVLLFTHISAFAQGDLFDLQITQMPGDASCRGIVVDSEKAIWVGGTQSTLLCSTDQGQSWNKTAIAAPDGSDFRDVEEPSEGVIVVMSAGTGAASRLLRTEDQGASWDLVLENPDESGFFNGVAFNSMGFGALVGDPIDGRLTVFVSADSGKQWSKVDGPEVAPGEYGFAASGTGVVVTPEGAIGILTGGSRCRFCLRAAEETEWTSRDVGMRHGTDSAGGFSMTLRGLNGVAVGGDYQKPQLSQNNVAYTRDGGKTWTVPEARMPHKACVVAITDTLFLTCGRTGIAVSSNAGDSWKEVSRESFYAMAVTPVGRSKRRNDREVWLTGADGRVARLTLDINSF